jgi:hypothetical protein
MQDLDPVAKRIYNVAPEPVRLTLDDGTAAVYHLSSAEFFQREFRAEGGREGDDADYRLVTGDDDRSVLLGRRAPDEAGWTVVGEVVAADRASDGTDDGERPGD